MLAAAFDRCDVIVAPTTPRTATDLSGNRVTVAGVSMDVRAMTARLTRPFNMSGSPAVSIPCGFGSDGLPIGLQIAGPNYADDRVLKVADIIIMGHAQCGGIGALLRGAGPTGADFVQHWMEIANPARDRALAMTEGDAEKAQTLCEHEAVKVSLDHLMTFPWVRERVESGALKLHGWYFGIESGELLRLEKDGKFRAV